MIATWNGPNEFILGPVKKNYTRKLLYPYTHAHMCILMHIQKHTQTDRKTDRPKGKRIEGVVYIQWHARDKNCLAKSNIFPKKLITIDCGLQSIKVMKEKI